MIKKIFYLFIITFAVVPFSIGAHSESREHSHQWCKDLLFVGERCFDTQEQCLVGIDLGACQEQEAVFFDNDAESGVLPTGEGDDSSSSNLDVEPSVLPPENTNSVAVDSLPITAPEDIPSANVNTSAQNNSQGGSGSGAAQNVAPTQVPTTGTSGDFDNDVIEGDGRTQVEIDAGAGAGAAQEDGLVPCGRGSDVANACTVCDFFVLADRIIDFLTGLLFFIAMVIITVAGVTYIVSAGNPGLISTAKSAIKAAFFGAVIVLAAWVLITWGIDNVATEQGVLASENALGLYRVTGTWDFECSISVPIN